MESGDHVVEFARVAAVEDDTEAMVGELMGEAFADTAAGAGYEGPGVGAVTVAWERAWAHIQIYKSTEADDKG